MAFSTLTSESLLQLWRERLLPQLESERAPHLVLARPAGYFPTLRAWPRAVAPLAEPRGSNSLFITGAWPSAGVHSIRFPILLFVVEGEADFRIGATRAQLAEARSSSDCGCQAVALPEGTFFLIPPDVPFSDGSHPHWERAHLPAARSHLLWIHVFPTGLSFHACRTSGVKHELSSSLFLKDARLMSLVDFLISELRATEADELAATLLRTFLGRIEARLSSPGPWLSEMPSHPGSVRPSSSSMGAVALQQACSHIQRHLQDPLTPESVAARAHVSVSHLNRLFRAELGVSIMQFVMQARVEAAQGLLQTTDLPISDIARLVGFTRPAHLSQVFTRLAGTSPLGFRRSKRLAR